LALLPLAMHQANPNHIDWIGHLAFGDRIEDSGVSFLTGETGRVIGAVGPRERYALVPLVLVAAILGLGVLRGRRREWSAAAIGLVIGIGSVALALAAVAVGKDYILARNLLPALLPLLAAIAVPATFVRIGRVGVALVAALCVYWLGFDVYVANTPALQRPDWRGVAQTLGPATRPRVIVTWALGVAPLEYYLRDGTSRVKSGPFAVPEVDVVSKTSADKYADPLAAIFPHRQVHDLGRFTVTRYLARHRLPLGMRLLRHHVRTGFPTNAVMVAGGRKVGLASTPAHRRGYLFHHRGRHNHQRAHYPGINRVPGHLRTYGYRARSHGQGA
jgi:hypothetical protein